MRTPKRRGPHASRVVGSDTYTRTTYEYKYAHRMAIRSIECSMHRSMARHRQRRTAVSVRPFMFIMVNVVRASSKVRSHPETEIKYQDARMPVHFGALRRRKSSAGGGCCGGGGCGGDGVTPVIMPSVLRGGAMVWGDAVPSRGLDANQGSEVRARSPHRSSHHSGAARLASALADQRSRPSMVEAWLAPSL